MKLSIGQSILIYLVVGILLGAFVWEPASGLTGHFLFGFCGIQFIMKGKKTFVNVLGYILIVLQLLASYGAYHVNGTLL